MTFAISSMISSILVYYRIEGRRISTTGRWKRHPPSYFPPYWRTGSVRVNERSPPFSPVIHDLTSVCQQHPLQLMKSGRRRKWSWWSRWTCTLSTFGGLQCFIKFVLTSCCEMFTLDVGSQHFLWSQSFLMLFMVNGFLADELVVQTPI